MLEFFIIALVIALVGGAGLTATWAMSCTVDELIAGNVDGLSSGAQVAVITSNAFNEAGVLNADSTPAGTKHASFIATLVSGAYTINLAALPGLNGALIDCTGLKLQILRIKPLGANGMVLSEGASNGYAIGGNVVAFSGGVSMVFANGKTPTIASGDRTIDIAGTAVQTAEVTIVCG